MQRIDGTGVKATKDTYAADSSNSGYFEQGGSTVVTADWANSVQEELIAVQALRGASPDKTDDNQCATALNGIKALDAAASDTTNTTSTQTRAVLACNTGRASGAQSLSAACTGAHASGSNSAAVASGLATASGAQSASLASNAATVASDNSACIASLNCTTDAANEQNAVIASDDCDITGDESAIIASASSTGNGTVSGDQSALLATDNCDVSGDQSAAVASDACTVSGDEAATLASNNCTASGANSSAISSDYCTVSVVNSATLGCAGASGDVLEVAKPRAVAIGSIRSKIAVGSGGGQGVLLGSSRCEFIDDNAVAVGYHAHTTPTYNGSNQNLKLRIDCTTGNVDTVSGGTFNAGSLDYAEMFENAAPGTVHEPGLIMTRKRSACDVAQKGDRVLGIVSAVPGVLGGAAKLGWSARYLVDEWGRQQTETVEMVRWAEIAEKTPDVIVREGYTGPVADAPPQSEWPADAVTFDATVDRSRKVSGPVRDGKPTSRVEHYTEQVPYVSWSRKRQKQPAQILRAGYDGPVSGAPSPIPEDAERWTVEAPVERPDYDPSAAYKARDERPEEWTAVGLMGQLRVRVDDTVQPDDFVVPFKDGIGTASKKPGAGRPVECMEILSPFDADRGFAIALCLVG